MIRSSSPSVAIVGAGASGVLLANALVRAGTPLDVVLIDPKPGRGIAYGGLDEQHLLNVPAGELSLDQRSPGGFVDWLNTREQSERVWTGGDFAPRRLYGDYLEERLANLRNRTPGLGTTRTAPASAVAAARRDEGWTIRLGTRESVEADVLVLATGLSRPRPLVFLGRGQVEAHVHDDPWDDVDVRAIRGANEVLLVGAGPTAADVATAIWRRAPQTRIIALSRHGLAPRSHPPAQTQAPVLTQPLPTTATELHELLRSRADLREGEQAIRPGVLQGMKRTAAVLWAGLPALERDKFRRNLQSYWNVERRRLAPSQAAVLQEAIQDGRLEFVQGRLAEAKALKDGSGALVALVTGAGPRAITVAHIVNCTGPEADVYRSRNPLLLDLLAQGLVSADPLGVGLRIDERGAALDGSGVPAQRLFAIGQLTEGRFFEASEIPELRVQAERLAAEIGAVLGPPVSRAPVHRRQRPKLVGGEELRNAAP